MSEQRRTSSLGPTEMFLLREWGCTLRRAFHEMPYLVGSVARAEAWRDVDVRMMLDDDHALRALSSEAFDAMNVAFTVWGQRATDLPIDFQFQSMAEANKSSNDGRRIPIGMGAWQSHPDDPAAVPAAPKDGMRT